MSLIECADCKKQISSEAKNCPACGRPRESEGTAWLWCMAVFGVFVIGMIVWIIIGPNLMMEDITRTVAADAEQQYRIAEREGDPVQKCVQAGYVAAAHLQAKNEDDYTLWKMTQRTDCRESRFLR
jgi:hypothetical protein